MPTPAPAPTIANVGELVSRSARAFARQLAVTSATRSLTYAELEQRSNRLANALRGMGPAMCARKDSARSAVVTITAAPLLAVISPTSVGDRRALNGALVKAPL